MRIAVNCRFLHTPHATQSRYAASLLLPWIQQQPAGVVLVADQPGGIEGVPFVHLTPRVTGMVNARIWYDVKLPALLKKEQCTLYIGSDGQASLTAKTAQLLLLPRLAFLQYPKLFQGNEQTALFQKAIKKATHIVVASAFAKQELAAKGVDESKITVIPPVTAPAFQPVSWSLKEKTKTTYAGGCEYFVCYGTLYPYRNLGLLLKAFSVFKKWQHSNMKLLLVGRLPARHEEELDKLDNYKFRNDVVLLPDQPPETMARIVASAYAVLQPSSYEEIGWQALEALACEVPVVAAHTGALAEWCGDAALYTGLEDANMLGQQLIRIYKDENLRSGLIQKGSRQLAVYRETAPVQQLASLIQQLGKG